MNRRSVRVRVLAIIVSLMIATSSLAAPRDNRTAWGGFERVIQKILHKIQKTFRLQTYDDGIVAPKP